MLPLTKDQHNLLQVGLIGYEQVQTTDNTGPNVIPQVAAATHYKVNALGASADILLLGRKTFLGFKYLKEFSNKSTVQGKSIQIYAAITF